MLAEYDQHGRIIGGEPEQMMDAAAAAYVALTADGTDVLLMAADHALRRELSRRIRDDLIRLGIVPAGPAVRIADGAQASPGDLIICTRNDHTVEAGEPGRTLANGDLLRIEAVTRSGLIVRRALDADPRTGQRRWTDRTFVYADYRDAELGYAVTDHVAQGRTVHTGLAVITGTEDRQHAYVALTRGTDVNLAYVFTVSPKLADPAPGPRPAPELARYDQIHAERTGVPAPATPPAPPGTALAVLAGVLDRDGQQRSATQTRNQALADADHLAILHAIWTAETTPAREQRYRDLLMAILPPGDRREPGHQARWLWRTLRAAELAGLDAGQVLAAAVGERDLAGARDLAAVIDARLRYRLGALVPHPPGPWSAQVPAIADPERRAYLAQIAALMDARKDRIGEHAADHAPPWAVTALGPVPAPPAGPAGLAAAGRLHRRLAGTVRLPPPRRPDRPRTRRGRPGPAGRLARGLRRPRTRRRARRARHARRDAAAPARHLPDRDRLGAASGSATSSARSAPPPGRPAWPACAPAPKPPPPPSAATPRQPPASTKLAASYQALHDAYRQREDVFAATMADRADWEPPPAHQRHLAVAADAELRRRHPGQHYPPLRSAEPEPATRTSATSSP